MEPFEYAIKKDVRNNPIVREVDETRQRELWKSATLAGPWWCCSFRVRILSPPARLSDRGDEPQRAAQKRSRHCVRNRYAQVPWRIENLPSNGCTRGAAERGSVVIERAAGGSAAVRHRRTPERSRIRAARHLSAHTVAVLLAWVRVEARLSISRS
jgi:hypothetical protein